MNIAFCDDDIVLLENLIPLVKSLIDKHNIYNFEFEYYSYSDPTLLLEDHKKLKFDAAFLDIEMPNMLGLSAADILYKENESIFIFYVTSFNEYARQSIKHRVFRFIEKNDKNELEESIQAMLEDLVTLKANYVIIRKYHSYVIPVSSINYFESAKNDVKIHTDTKVYTQRITIKELLCTLPAKAFCRCHSAFIVNVEKIKEITKDTIVLTNEDSIPISAKYYNSVYSMFIDTF